jgi:hypothetical protein
MSNLLAMRLRFLQLILTFGEESGDLDIKLTGLKSLDIY